MHTLNYRLSIIVFILVTSISWLQAQDTTETHIKVFTYSKDGSTNYNSDYEPFTFSIKVNPTALLNGSLPILFEYAPLDFLGIEVGAGLTTTDFIGAGLFEFRSTENNLHDYIVPYGNTNVESGLGSIVSISAKFYPEKEKLEGPYFGMLIRNRTHKYDIFNPNGFNSGFNNNGRDIYIEKANDLRRRVLDIGFIGGWQASWDSNIVIEWNTGIMFRTAKTEFIAGNYYQGNQNTFDDYYIETIEEDIFTGPALIFNFKVGIGF